MRPIDADELKIDYGFTWDDIAPTYDEMYALIDRQPTIELERKKGKWTFHKDGSGTCSECGITQKAVWDMDNWQNYCGHCGADMRGEQDENQH